MPADPTTAALHSPTLHTARRVRTPVPESVDVAVIGCGPGGLQAGALLARGGLKVACFDQHYVAGGCATMFERGRSDARWRFDVGLHYIGDCGPQGQIPKLLAAAGVTDIAYAPMDPDGFDTLVFPDLEFRIPVGLERYRARLHQTFPAEGKGIDKYCRFLDEVWTVVSRSNARGGRFDWRTGLDVLLRGRTVARYQHATVAQVLDDCTRDPALRAVMLGQSGDYGVAPSQASALLHAGLAMHYFAGAYYPVGGGQILADKLADTIEAHGGHVILRRGIARILVEDGKAVGVQTEADAKNPARDVRAKVVISNADIVRTMLDLLPRAALPPQWKTRAEGWRMGGALWLTCAGLEGTPEALGLRRTNYWQFDSYDVEQFYAQAATAGKPTPRGCYITSATAKDPDTAGHAPAGKTSVEVMALVPADATIWGVSAGEVASGDYRRNLAYQERKAAVEADLLARLARVLPKSAGKVEFVESASPLTHMRFTRATGGTGYGLAATPAQFQQGRPGYRGPLPGLYLCGASTRAGHGVVGALMSGLRAAQKVGADLAMGDRIGRA
ncbi:MAG: NAD(P)/FAD-dependent oxidoreductase [Deltaproteobacteria bacterium]|nr:NAD(P)/FAD-dependent oxidoreductase [Deltaproteobacteria bacterium]